MLSIVVPTFNNVNFLEECLDSILDSCENFDSEILVGIDNCLDTLNYVKSKKLNSKIKFLFFESNVGPYVIKNTLSQQSNFSNLLFFDSDDIMNKQMVDVVLNNLKKHQCVRFKYQEFKTKKEINPEAIIGEGVFAISKSSFLNVNGFYPWRCAADSEFRNRNPDYCLISKPLFLRRIHSSSLTNQKNTSYNSSLRMEYIGLIRSLNKKKPEKLAISKCKLII